MGRFWFRLKLCKLIIREFFNESKKCSNEIWKCNFNLEHNGLIEEFFKMAQTIGRHFKFCISEPLPKSENINNWIDSTDRKYYLNESIVN